MRENNDDCKYDLLSAAIGAAGFYHGGIEKRDGWDRMTVCSSYENGVLSGNSFWVTKLSADWYLGTWGGMIYRISDPNRIAEFCIAWLKREPTLTSDFSPEIKDAFGLIRTSDEEFDRVAGSMRTQVEDTAIAEVQKRMAVEPQQLTVETTWDGENWQVSVWRLPATGAADYSLLISGAGEPKEFHAREAS